MYKDLRRSNSRGKMNANGIEARFSFDFGRWKGPGGSGYGSLVVLNEDVIKPNAGFAMHPHDNIEIIMMPLSGSIAHEDSLGNKFNTADNEVVYMSAGSGIMHSQFNARTDSVDHHLQIWIAPRSRWGTPKVEKRHFDEQGRQSRFQLIASGDGIDDSFALDQDANISRAKIEQGKTITWSSKKNRRVYLHVISGEVLGQDRADRVVLSSGDAWAIESTDHLTLYALGLAPADVLVIDMI